MKDIDAMVDLLLEDIRVSQMEELPLPDQGEDFSTIEVEEYTYTLYEDYEFELVRRNLPFTSVYGESKDGITELCLPGELYIMLG